jgi:hypothetical protein
MVFTAFTRFRPKRHQQLRSNATALAAPAAGHVFI